MVIPKLNRFAYRSEWGTYPIVAFYVQIYYNIGMSWDERQERAARFAERNAINTPSGVNDQTALVPASGLRISNDLIWDRLNVQTALLEVKNEVWWEGTINPIEDRPQGLVLSSNPFPVVNVIHPKPWDRSPYGYGERTTPIDVTLYQAEDHAALSVYLAPRQYKAPSSLFIKLEGLYGEQDPEGNATLLELLMAYHADVALKHALEPQSLDIVGLKGYNTLKEGKFERNLTHISRRGGNLTLDTEIVYPESPDTEERFNAALVQMVELQTTLNSIPRQFRARSEDMIALLPKGLGESNYASYEEVWKWYVKFVNQDKGFNNQIRSVTSNVGQRLGRLLRLPPPSIK
jgi:hypothetical protein